MEIGALGYLIKPLSIAAILPMLRTALARAQDIDGLQGALESNRVIAAAVGMLMQADQLDQATAFERLRQRARNERRKLEEVASTMINADRSYGH